MTTVTQVTPMTPIYKKEVKMKEKILVEKIKTYLKTVPELFFWKEHGGCYGTSGLPDIIVCYRGRFVAFECKTENNKPTVLQTVTMRQIYKAGGYALIVKSVEEVKEVLKSFKNDK